MIPADYVGHLVSRTLDSIADAHGYRPVRCIPLVRRLHDAGVVEVSNGLDVAPAPEEATHYRVKDRGTLHEAFEEMLTIEALRGYRLCLECNGGVAGRCMFCDSTGRTRARW